MRKIHKITTIALIFALIEACLYAETGYCLRLPLDGSSGRQTKVQRRLIGEVKRIDLEALVEEPLVAACSVLNYKGIRTTNSSANGEINIGIGYAWIKIDPSTLSAENQAIAKKLLYNDDLHIPVTAESTVEEVSQKANELVSQFEYQDNYSDSQKIQIEEFVKFYRDTEGDKIGEGVLLPIFERLIRFFGAFHNFKDLKMLELGPREKEYLIKFLRTKDVGIEGLHRESETEFTRTGDYTVLLSDKDKYPDEFLDVVYCRNAVGCGIQLEGVDVNSVFLEYRKVIIDLFKHLSRVLKPRGMIIIDSYHFSSLSNLAQFSLQKSDFENMGFEIFEWDENKDKFVFRKERDSSTQMFDALNGIDEKRTML